jgi:hypothetical protein
MRLGVTLFGKGGSPFPTFPQSLKVVLGWIWEEEAIELYIESLKAHGEEIPVEDEVFGIHSYH